MPRESLLLFIKFSGFQGICHVSAQGIIIFCLNDVIVRIFKLVSVDRNSITGKLVNIFLPTVLVNNYF